MALRNQPYLPLYAQDFLTDEKLIECSALATGVCIKILCVMHKSEEYGKIYLKEKDKRTESVLKNLSVKLSKHLPWDIDIIEQGLKELIDEGVMQLEGDCLSQKRMIADNELSNKRAVSGRKGGRKKRIPKNAAGNKEFS